MPPSNPIITLAEHALQEQFSRERLEQESEALVTRGVGDQDVYEALQTVLTPASPTPLVDTVAQICVHILSTAGHVEFAAEIHFHVGNVLAERYDQPSLSLAIQHYQAARQRLAPQSPTYGRAQMNEGVTRWRLAAWGEEPHEHLQEAMRLYQQARQWLDPQSSDYGLLQMNEGNARLRLAESDIEPQAHLSEAIRLFQQARERLAPQSPDYGRAQTNEGNARLRLAESDIESQAHLSEAIRLFQQARERLAPQSPDYGRVQVGEGNARLQLAELGTEPQAHLLQAAVELFEQAAAHFDANSPDWGITRCNQARALRQLGRLEEAYQRLKEGLHVVEDVRAQMRREPERIAFLETMAGPYAWMVGLCIKLADSAATPEQKDQWRWEAWHWVSRSKSRALLELLANARPRLTEADLPLWEAYQQSEQALDSCEWEIQSLRHRLAQVSDEKLAAQLAADLAKQEQEREQLQQAYKEQRDIVLETTEGAWVFETVAVPPPQQVVESLRQLAGLRPSPYDVAQQGSGREPVAHKSLVVDFFTLSDAEMAVFLLPLWEDREDAPPLIQRLKVTHETVLQMAGSLFAALAILKPQTRAGHRGPTGEASPAARTAAEAHMAQLPAELSVLLEPWMPAVDQWQPTELVLSPHFLLNLLPLHAALWQDKPLIEQYPVVYLPSAALAQEVLRSCKPVNGEALLLGNPTGDLKGAEREVAWVDKWLAGRGMHPHRAVGPEATTRYVHTHAPAAGILHFACHSVLDFADFLRSGVELADRRLTVLDVSAGLELAQAVPGRTDELMALVRVFLYAGSPTVIASLWALNDGAGATFADHFYRHWVGAGQPLAVAFQQAMVQLKETYANPFYWAPLVLMGAWRT